MTLTIEKIQNTKTVQGLLECTNKIRKESFDYAFDNKMVTDETFKSYRQFETMAYERAIEIATTPEELEACAVSIENDSLEYLDPDGRAEEIRIKTYGIEWYLAKEISSPAYKEFVRFTNKMGIENPFEELEQAIAHEL